MVLGISCYKISVAVNIQSKIHDVQFKNSLDCRCIHGRKLPKMGFTMQGKWAITALS